MNALAVVKPRREDVTVVAAQGMPAPAARILRSGDYRRMPWKNGAGRTSEILCEPTAGDWRWRLSIAEIEVAAPFSSYPGVDRELVLLSGNGMRLRFDDGQVSELLPPYGALRFPGERRLVGEPIDGQSRDFNLMWKRGEIEACLWRRPLAGTMVLFAAPGETWVVHLLTGQGRFADESGLGVIDPGDTAILCASGNDRVRFALDASGEALVAHIREIRTHQGTRDGACA